MRLTQWWLDKTEEDGNVSPTSAYHLSQFYGIHTGWKTLFTDAHIRGKLARHYQVFGPKAIIPPPSSIDE